MHIPDGVLSPSTSVAVSIAMLPVWAIAGRQVRKSLGTRQVPMLALGAAFCFSIMMFNIPALGGTTAHPVAGTLLAVLLGPWAALIGISVALAIQALFFADGGLLAYGPNCFTMAFVLPFVGYSVYRLIAGRSAGPRSPLRALAAGIGAYVGLNVAAAMVALLLGIQPVLFHEPNGHALFFPFGLKITLPAMLGTHLLVAGPAEAAVTALVVRYLAAAGHTLYGVREEEGVGCSGIQVSQGNGGILSVVPARAADNPLRRRDGLWIGLLALIALSPLGLLAKGDAWGEWDAEGVKQQIKKIEGREYLPAGLARTQQQAYKGVKGLSDYAQPEGGRNTLGYIGAGILGVTVIAAMLLLIGRLLASAEERGTKPSLMPEHQTPEHPTPQPPIPPWLLSSADPAPAAPVGRPSNRYLERTLAEITESAATALYGERWARQAGYLQRLDARAKVIGFFGLILVTACLHQPATLLGLSILTLLLATASHLPLAVLLRRVWLSVPLFVGALALPMIFSVVTPGRALLVLAHHPYLAVTAPGLTGAGLLILRVGVAMSLAALLTMTTGWNELLRALRALLIPRLFLTVLTMTYRYLALLLQTAAEMFVARRSRTVGRQSNAEGRRFVGASVGSLYGKTLALTEEVHAAMVSRGFNGEMRTLTQLRWRTPDSLWTLGVALLALLALGGEHVRSF